MLQAFNRLGLLTTKLSHGLPQLCAARGLLTSRATWAEVTSSPDELYRRVQVEVSGHDPAVLQSYEKFACLAGSELGLDLCMLKEPWRDIERYTLLKSVHIFKKHRVQYETRTYYKVLELKHVTGSTASTYLEYIQRNLPEGVAMKVTKHQLTELPEQLQPLALTASKS